MYTQVHSGCLHQHAPKSLYCIILGFNTASSHSREKSLSLESSPDVHPQPLVLTIHISLLRLSFPLHRGRLTLTLSLSLGLPTFHATTWTQVCSDSAP